MADDIISKYYKRVARRALVKSSFLGLIIGFFAMLVTSVVLFALGETGLFWIAFIVLGVCFGVSMPLFYFLRYRPTRKDVAAVVDNLGLEERLTTMVELEGSKSYIAKIQRQDTVAAAGSVPATAIRMIVSTALIVLLVVAIVLGLGFTGYNILVEADVAPGFNDVIDSIPGIGEEPVIYTVTYEAYDLDEYYYDEASDTTYEVGDGNIAGDWIQFVEEGGDCTSVYAEALDDSVFLKWVYYDTDGAEISMDEPQRTDTEIYDDMNIYAVFVLVDEDGEGDGDGDGEEGDESDGDSSDSDSSEMGEEDSESDDGSSSSGSSGGDGEDDEESESEGESDGDDGESDSDDDSDSQDSSTGAGSGGDMDRTVNNGDDDYGYEVDDAAGNGRSEADDSDIDQKLKDALDNFWDGLLGGA